VQGPARREQYPPAQLLSLMTAYEEYASGEAPSHHGIGAIDRVRVVDNIADAQVVQENQGRDAAIVLSLIEIGLGLY
jgi:hypothetical protein